MGKNEWQAYLDAIQAHCKKAKSTILDKFCAVCGYQHKYAIRLLSQRSKSQQQQPVHKLPHFLPELKSLWLTCDQMLKAQVKCLEMEKDIFKKATVFFATETK